MRTVTGQWATTIADSHQLACTVESSRGGGDVTVVPIESGTIVYDSTADARRRCLISVPRYGPDGFNWMPGGTVWDYHHPLAVYGQRLQIKAGVVHPDGTTELLNMGWFLITETKLSPNGETVNVTGSCLWRLLLDAKVPYAARDAFAPDGSLLYTTIANALARNDLETSGDQILPVSYQAPNQVLKSRFPTPGGSDRTEAIKKLARQASRSVFVNDDAQIRYEVEPSTPAATSVLTLTDGQNGTILTRARGQSRDQIYNSSFVIVTSRTTGKVRFTAGPFATGAPATTPLGPYGHVPYTYVTSEIDSQQEATDYATAQLSRVGRRGREEEVVCVANPALELMDTVTVTTDDLGSFQALVTAITLPLTAGQGGMTLTVASGT